MKLLFPPPGEAELVLSQLGSNGPARPESAPRPSVRTYTPRRFDEGRGLLEVQFVLHGAGAASDWVTRAKAGDQVAVGPPGGRLRMDPEHQRWWIAGDESALPAIGTLLEALPPTATAEVHVEVSGTDDHIPLGGPPGTSVEWHQRRSADAFGEEMIDAATTSSPTTGTNVWVAGEATAIRRARRVLLEKGVEPDRLVTRGYWRIGATDHPDHDYGVDA